MNPLFFYSAVWSFRGELRIILFVFILIFLLPVLAVILLTNVGVNVVSDKLVVKNQQTNGVVVRNPRDGSAVTVIQSLMHWPMSGIVTLEFGAVDLPYQPLHTGIDIANVQGTPITPFMDGTVIYAGEIFWGYGKHIIIDHGNNITSLYAHLGKLYVYSGEKVTMDQVIGEEGETGWATGPHLHFETRVYDIPVNPKTFLNGNP